MIKVIHSNGSQETVEELENGGEDVESHNTEDSTQDVDGSQEQETTEDSETDLNSEQEEQKNVVVPPNEEGETDIKTKEQEEETEQLSQDEETNSNEGKQQETNDSKEQVQVNTSLLISNRQVLIKARKIDSVTFFHKDLLDLAYNENNDILEVGNIKTNIGEISNNNGNYTIELPKDYNGDILLTFDVTDGEFVIEGNTYIKAQNEIAQEETINESNTNNSRYLNLV
jgi:hypothetical protein